MKVETFAVKINNGTEDNDGYVKMVHATQYSIELTNLSTMKCDAHVTIDGKFVGLWRIPSRSLITVDRPVNDNGVFTFYKIDSIESKQADLRKNEFLGLITVVFKPEKKKPMNLSMENDFTDSEIAFSRKSSNNLSAGGTGLSGESNQRFTSAPIIDYDENNFVTINLRLGATNHAPTPRPLKPAANPVPPSLL